MNKEDNNISIMFYPQVEGITPTVVEPCTDAISRHAAINIVVCDILSSAIVYGRTEEGMAARKAIVDGLRRLPPVTPAEKVGHWISNAEDDLKISEYTCSNCKGLSDEDSDFCPKCGSYNGGAK